MISFIETKLFTRLVQQYLSDDEYSRLQQALLSDPEAGAVIRDSGGVRKLRWGCCWTRQTRRYSGHLFSAHSARPDLAAHAVRKECHRDYLGQCTETDQGRN
jgi:hypothetical protein